MAHKTRNSTNDFSLVSLCTVHWCLGAMSGALTQIVYWSSFLFVYGKGLGWHYSSLVPRPHPSARERGSGILSRFSWHFRCLRNSKNHVLAHVHLYEPSEQPMIHFNAARMSPTLKMNLLQSPYPSRLLKPGLHCVCRFSGSTFSKTELAKDTRSVTAPLQLQTASRKVF